MKKILIAVAVVVLVLAAVAFGLDRSSAVLAQEPQPPVGELDGGQFNLQPGDNNQPAGEYLDSEINVMPTAQMSYQGRLEIDGSPCNGSQNVTFRLYSVSSGGTALWTETQTVACENGLFSVMLGSVTPLPQAVYFQQQLWLGIQPEGAAAELTPRQMLGTVGYAMNLLPGATMIDNTAHSYGYGYSFFVSSEEHPAIYGGTFYTSTAAVTGIASGYDSPGVYGVTFGDDANCIIGDDFCNAGVVGQTYGDSYGSFNYSSARSGVLGVTNSYNYAAGFYNQNGTDYNGLHVYGFTWLQGDLTVTGSKSGYVVDIALNTGSETLERGDVVAVVGVDTPILGEIPVMRVVKANAENAASIVGVVDQLWEPCDRPTEELQVGEACGGYDYDATSFQPGQYISVVTLGAFQWLKVDASSAPIQAGDLLSISTTAGVAAVAQQITVEGVSFYAPGTIIGKALGELESGTGMIAVFVSLK